MRLTERDQRLVRDITLSHAMSRDQVISLGYFGSVTRTNTRLRELCGIQLLRPLDTPFLAQRLYVPGRLASNVVGTRIASILAGRTGSPRFLQHALAITNSRIALTRQEGTKWRFEQQLRATFRYVGREYLLKPDGLAITPDGLVAVEVDLGHVAPAKFREKLRVYDAFVISGECHRLWGVPSFRLLTITTGRLRASRLLRLAPAQASFDYQCVPHDDLGIAFPGAWS